MTTQLCLTDLVQHDFDKTYFDNKNDISVS